LSGWLLRPYQHQPAALFVRTPPPAFGAREVQRHQTAPGVISNRTEFHRGPGAPATPTTPSSSPISRAETDGAERITATREIRLSEAHLGVKYYGNNTLVPELEALSRIQPRAVSAGGGAVKCRRRRLGSGLA